MPIAAPILCLALNIYHEARNQPIQGQIAVAHVTINRAKETGANICDVVFKPSQFSWTLQPHYVEDRTAWARSVLVADRTLRGYVGDNTGGANHYHADYVNPSWNAEMIATTQIGRHIFYFDKKPEKQK